MIMVNEEIDATAAAILLRAVSNPARLRIVLCLLNGERSVTELETQLGLRQPNLSQHLAELRNVSLVVTRREVKSVYYRLSDDAARHFVTGLLQGLGGSAEAPAPMPLLSLRNRKRPPQAAMFARLDANVREPV